MENSRILIVDDDPGLRKSLADILRIKGYEAFAAKDGEEGLAFLRENAVNLALIDLGLPDMSGLVMLERIKSWQPTAEAIILTGHATLESASDATNRGAFSYLLKPYDIDQLLLQVRRAMEKQRAEAALRLRQRAIESSSNGIMITDASRPEGPIIYLNPAFERITGYGAQEVLGRNPRFLIGNDQEQMGLEEIRAALHEKREGFALLRNYRKDGTLFWNELSIAPVKDDGGSVTHFIGIINDITERKLYEEQLEYQSTHDGLTGLPNRNLLNDRIRQALSFGYRYQQQVALLLIDLDHFKFINDSLGHETGDRLLKLVAERLTASLRSVDTVARHGGDEFVVVLTGLERSEDAAHVAQKIREEISRPFRVDGQELVISGSIGISINPKDGADPQTLLKNADAAMYRAKDQGRNNFQFFTGELNVRVVARMNMEKHLRRAMEREELLVYYQPQVDLARGRVTGMEALLRWQSPELGMVSPADFIPLAEETGLIVPIGKWILESACRQNRRWLDAGFPPVTVAVNLSARQFQRSDLAGVVARVLHDSGLKPQYLELEITESVVMQDVESASAQLSELKGMGVQLAMDDFGTGYSSLSYLKRFPFDKLKIDLSFVRDITTDPESAAIARAVIALAHSLNLRVIAEGVETAEQMEYLRSHACDEMQGFHFSRPLPAQEFEELLRERRQLRFAEESAGSPERTLLLVDDEPDVLRALERLLSNDGYRILTATSAEQGFDLLAVNRIGVVVCDQRMPGMDGSEFLRRIKELYPDTVRIALSGNADLEMVTDAINRGAIYRFFGKPWEDEFVRESVMMGFRRYEMVMGAGNPRGMNMLPAGAASL